MSHRNALTALSSFGLPGFLLFATLGFAQYPTGQYPPGQYPPGQYPPGQYPPGQVRLPGGIPVNVPVPEIKLPQRRPKDAKKDDKPATSSDDLKITLASADGILRKLGEKDLLLGIGQDRVLKFRLLAKTLFRDPKGEPVRDSLLHPGDQLSVQANTDDPETALRVILLHNGTRAEREAASAPVPETRILTPLAEDLKNPHAVVARERSAPSEAEPAASIGAGSSDPVAYARRRVNPENAGGSTESIIEDARAAAAEFESDLPNFLVKQATTRYRGSSSLRNWEAIDVVTADVAVSNGKEEYRNILVNGRAPNKPVEKTGSWSTGEFSVTLQDILSPLTAAVFVKRGSETVAGREAWVYNLSVLQQNSHWTIVSSSGRKYSPAYGGTIWIDKQTHRVLRIEQRTLGMPNDFDYDKAESMVEYGFVRIDTKEYLLPVTSSNSACFTGSGGCVKNEISFRNYRRFSSESTVKFEKFAKSN